MLNQLPAPSLEQSKPQRQSSHILAADFRSVSYLLALPDNQRGTREPSADFEKDQGYHNGLSAMP
jgi:hypothetical protein